MHSERPAGDGGLATWQWRLPRCLEEAPVSSDVQAFGPEPTVSSVNVSRTFGFRFSTGSIPFLVRNMTCHPSPQELHDTRTDPRPPFAAHTCGTTAAPGGATSPCIPPTGARLHLRLAEISGSGGSKVLPASALPPEDWISISAICDDLVLLKQDWVKVLRAGYFAERTHPREGVVNTGPIGRCTIERSVEMLGRRLPIPFHFPEPLHALQSIRDQTALDHGSSGRPHAKPQDKQWLVEGKQAGAPTMLQS